MRKLISRIIIIIISVVLLLNTMSIATNQSDLNDVNNKIKTTQSQLNGVQTEKTEAKKEVEKLDDQIEEYQAQIDELNNQISTLNTQINESQKKLDEAQENYTKQEDLLKKRLVASYMAGETSYLDFLLSSDNIVDFISNYYLVSEIAKADTELLEKIEKQKQEIEQAKKTLEESKSQLATSKASKQSVATQLQTAKNEKNKQVANLSEEEKELQSKIDEFKREKEAIEAEIQRIARQSAQKNTSGGNTVTHNGQMTWPCPSSSNVVSGFGGRSSPGGGVGSTNHKGVDISASHGASIVSAGNGTVITVSHTCSHDYPKTVRTKCSCGGGYGNYVMVSHGNGIVTVYAHCSAIYVSTGQTVSAGQQIAAVGTTGYSTGNHLHFGVLLNGTYVNPLPYIR